MASKIELSKEASLPVLSGGGQNPHYLSFVDLIIRNNGKFKPRGNKVFIDNVRDLSLKEMNDLITAVEGTFPAGSIEIHNVRAWLRITQAAKTNSIPRYVPFDDVVDVPAVVDGRGNIITPATMRRPRWEEVRLDVQRSTNTHIFVPAAAERGRGGFFNATILKRVRGYRS
jgi:hypothetical protein